MGLTPMRKTLPITALWKGWVSKIVRDELAVQKVKRPRHFVRHIKIENIKSDKS